MSNVEPGCFTRRHIGSNRDDHYAMLRAMGLESLDQLIGQTVPASIRMDHPLDFPEGESEHAFLERLRGLASLNRSCSSYIGMGYYPCVTPPVILRNIMENPSWYTPYTPYQAEISQGRLESLMNFQTMVMDLTGMEVANASLLDEATAAAEALALMHRKATGRSKKDALRTRCLVSDRVFPHVLDVLRTRAEPLQIDLEIGDVEQMVMDETTFGAFVQYPDDRGALRDWRGFIERAHASGVSVAVGSDLMALAIATPPGEMGADIVYGNAQRLGVPMGYGGPHAAFFAVRETLKRDVPGRIIGLSQDRHGRPAYRMALQTREQHIRREKATSNICTAQALLANMAAMYAVYHGPGGLRHIAECIIRHTRCVAHHARVLGYDVGEEPAFDTVFIRNADGARVREVAEKAGMNFRYFPDGHALSIALNETTTEQDVTAVLGVLAEAAGRAPMHMEPVDAGTGLPTPLLRTSPILTHPVFQSHHSETEMMRYIKQLERKDLGLDVAMIPLGSCTMKLNAAVEMIPVTWPAFANIHPFAPVEQAAGYHQIFKALEKALCAITGFAAVSLQPNSGAQGEYAGLLAIRAWHLSRNEPHRNVVLIPASAHGTNPASAVMAGMRVVVVQCEEDGYIHIADLQEKIETHRDALAALMVTYPSTYGIFEENIRDVIQSIHDAGGQVYMDGANLNAQVGLTSPALIGADVCHMNLHKTFAIPHGGGGPGMGPIAVAEHLVPFLPGHFMAPSPGSDHDVGAVSAAPWGSASILLISYAYMCLLGGRGMTEATRAAILHANYIKARLEKYYEVHYTGRSGRVAHELIFDLRPFKDTAGITETDVAKRLMDYGFHAPTVSWPVPGTMMIEPTESEPKRELDRFCDAMIAIHGEIMAVAHGEADREDNVLRNAPHTAAHVSADEWTHAYSRESAAFPVPGLREQKFWPAVGRVDNTYGDRNLVCSCPPVAAYA
jgi:glycine dehydrogenase